VHRDAGLKEDQDAARGWKLAFPDLRMTMLKEIGEGDLATVLYEGTGTNTGEGNGLREKIVGSGITTARTLTKR
jgi:hypothetical protein